MNKILLVVLQCAYGKTAKRRKQLHKRRIWLRGLWSSHTGRNLRKMIPEGYDIIPVNASPQIGNHVHAVFEPDSLYVGRIWEIVCPDVTLASGKVAQSTLRELGIKHVASPHPAWRQLTNEHIEKVRRELKRNLI